MTMAKKYRSSGAPKFVSSSIAHGGQPPHFWRTRDGKQQDVTVRRVAPVGQLPLAQRRHRALMGW